MKATSHAADTDIFIVSATLASMVMYIECLLAVGVSFDEARRRAIAATSFTGMTVRQCEGIVHAITNLPPSHLSREARRWMGESAYRSFIHDSGLKDTWLRRCLYLRFGIML